MSSTYPPFESNDRAAPIVILALWCGVVCGLVEGVVFQGLLYIGWLNWKNLELTGVSIEIIWIAALFDAVVFAVVGVALAMLARLLPGRRIFAAALFVFAFLMLFDWLAVALLGRLEHYAILSLALGLAAVVYRSLSPHWPRVAEVSRRSLPWVASTALLALLVTQSGLWLQERLTIAALPSAPQGAPNVLLIIVDALRADHLGAYGYVRPTSPNIDRLAREGVLFERAMATSSWTLPSHASMMTGRYPYEHRATWRPLLGERYPTIAEALGARGRRTGAFSANVFLFSHDQGFDRGFVHFEDYFNCIEDMAARTLYGRKIEKFVLRPLGLNDIVGRKRVPDVNRSLLRWIERDKERPFFAVLNYFDVHDPYIPPQPYRSRFSKLANPGGLINVHQLRYYPAMDAAQLQAEIDAYDGALTYVDENLGDLLEELGRRGVAANTLVLITADHGESFGEHGLLTHQNALYRDVIHVPLIIWWPGRVPSGVRVKQPVSNAALPATIMDLIGSGDQTLFPGPSLSPLWREPEGHPDWPSPLAELAHITSGPQQRPAYHGAMKSLVSGRWHYVVHETLGTELFDWEDDPREEHNLAAQPEMQATVRAFESDLQLRLARGEDR